MSQRVLIPSNLFYHWQDPLPDPDDPTKGFPQPNTGDVYFNVSNMVIRVFYEGGWHDAGGSSGGSGGDEVAVQDAEPTSNTLDLWVDTDAVGAYADHSDLAGLGEGDDHPQYLNTARADVQYVRAVAFVVSDDPAIGPPAGGVNTVWIEY